MGASACRRHNNHCGATDKIRTHSTKVFSIAIGEWLHLYRASKPPRRGDAAELKLVLCVLMQVDLERGNGRAD
jgi:hypothetical protein